MAEVTITRWRVPESFELAIEVSVESPPMKDAFYRHQDDRGEWGWYKMSIAEKPSAKVGSIHYPSLDRLVLQHPVLGKIATQFGYIEGDMMLQGGGEA